MSWITVTCGCGARTRAARQLAGGPVPCAECGRTCLAPAAPAREKKNAQSKAGGQTGKSKKGTTTRRRRRKLVGVDRSRASLARGRGRAARAADREAPPILIGVLALVALAAAFVFYGRAAGQTPLVFLMCSMGAVVIDLGLIVLAGAVLGLAVGPFVESICKVTLVTQASLAVIGLAYLAGGPVPWVVGLALFVLMPWFLSRLFEWSFGEAILVFCFMVLCQQGLASQLSRI